jgi:hypothetical protein
MSTPDPSSGPTPAPIPPQPETGTKKPVVVVSRFSARDLILVVVILVAIVGFIVLAVQYSTQKPKNMLRGVVQGRYATGERETLLDVRPRKGVSSKTVDTGYYLKVFVPDENRTYDVIVEKELWQQKKDGDSLDFLRPADEQKY